MKSLLYNFFEISPIHFDIYQQQSYHLDPKLCPIQLIKQLSKPKLASKLISMMNEKQQKGLKSLRKLCIIHWCLVYQPKLCQMFSHINFTNQSSDEWLNKNILKQYSLFLEKITGTQEYFSRIKPTHIVEFSFETLFYVINLLKDLLACVRKIASLARYYKKEEKSKFLLNDFVELIAYHSQQLYTTFKIILGEIIRFPQKYIFTHDQRMMIKYLLQDELTSINEELKNLFLDKYFFPYGKGYGIKLMKIEELTDTSRTFVDGLLFSGPVKSKKPKKKTLDSVLFDQTGKLNPQVYTSLAQIRLRDESMRNSMIEQGVRSHRVESSKYLEDISQIQV